MSEEQIKEKVYDLLSLSEDICILYEQLYENEINNIDNKEVIKKLQKYLDRESKIYKNMSRDDISKLMYYAVENIIKLDKIDVNDDKFYLITSLGFDFKKVNEYRFMTMLRDSHIIKNRLTRFDYTDYLYYPYEQDEEEKMYDDKLLNTILVETQIFNDFLELFVYDLNIHIKQMENNPIIKNILTKYKYIVVSVLGKNNLNLLDKDMEKEFICSRLLYDVLDRTSAGILYNYEIIRDDYLDKNLYRFFLESSEDISDNEDIQFTNKILDVAFINSIIDMYQEEMKKPYQIYKDTYNKIHDKKHIVALFLLGPEAKSLTLNK